MEQSVFASWQLSNQLCSARNQSRTKIFRFEIYQDWKVLLFLYHFSVLSQRKNFLLTRQSNLLGKLCTTGHHSTMSIMCPRIRSSVTLAKSPSTIWNRETIQSQQMSSVVWIYRISSNRWIHGGGVTRLSNEACSSLYLTIIPRSRTLKITHQEPNGRSACFPNR